MTPPGSVFFGRRRPRLADTIPPRGGNAIRAAFFLVVIVAGLVVGAVLVLRGCGG